ncbi:hypothetical protein B0T25DRAFT_223923 [Lasiosphaeria hispida]|uniref:Uncharacterized protein n=1 Tax=Lasiosphaeria hispida TaxID=260671 RepID=A0AAJ0MF07_9PEZI|nr:hypothetical protein B0T25DRAFT_223923 [Lasiosphaeria hispida]
MGYSIGDTVRVCGGSLVYKVIATTGCMITILVVNPQPDGRVLSFDPQGSIQTLDESRIEKVT